MRSWLSCPSSVTREPWFLVVPEGRRVPSGCHYTVRLKSQFTSSILFFSFSMLTNILHFSAVQFSFTGLPARQLLGRNMRGFEMLNNKTNPLFPENSPTPRAAEFQNSTDHRPGLVGSRCPHVCPTRVWLYPYSAGRGGHPGRTPSSTAGAEPALVASVHTCGISVPLMTSLPHNCSPWSPVEVSRDLEIRQSLLCFPSPSLVHPGAAKPSKD